MLKVLERNYNFELLTFNFELLNGWQVSKRFNASLLPFTTPYRTIAILAYSEQLGE